MKQMASVILYSCLPVDNNPQPFEKKSYQGNAGCLSQTAVSSKINTKPAVSEQRFAKIYTKRRKSQVTYILATLIFLANGTRLPKSICSEMEL